ncbi:MAG: glycosyltransferase, partial [Candidatus Pacebacteria bacterium]|nr:glycosyltransferase [Candidatus Paceibacterota bacterium]
ASLAVKNKLKWLGNESGFLFYKDFLALIELFRVLKKEKPEIVHLNSSKAGVIGALAGKMAGVKKIIFTAHGWVFSDEDLPFLKRFFYILVHKAAGFFQDKIINVSEHDRKLAIKYKVAPEEKLVTIKNGLDINYFFNNLCSKEEARKKITDIIFNDEFLISKINTQQKDLGGFWIGSIGRLVKEKNYKLFVEAVKILKENFQKEEEKLIFFIIGDGYEKESLKLKIKNLELEKNIFLLGEIENAYRLLKAFDLFVLPSRKEGLPYTLIEAMAAEVPIVASRVGGMTEVLEEEKGRLFNGGEANDLANKIKEVLEEKEETKKRREKAKKFAEVFLNQERMIQETEKIYLGND